MLRITKKTTKEGMALMVEGKIQGTAVQLLRDECRLHVATATRVTLDLAGVTYVDPEGARLLRSLAEEHVTITRCSALVAELCRR